MKLELTEQEVQSILVALSKFPYCEVAALIEKIHKQIPEKE